MAIKIKAVDQYKGDGADVFVKGLVDGSISVADFFAVMAMKGHAYIANFGVVTTPITPVATAVIDITKAFGYIVVPSNTTIIPVSISMYMEVYGTNAQFECRAISGTGGSRTSGGTGVTPANLRTDHPQASNCLCWSGDNTLVIVGATADLNEFWRDGQQFAITKTTASATAAVSDPVKFGWRAGDDWAPPIIVGASQLAVQQGSQAGQGFVAVKWIEFPSSWLP